MFENFKYYFTLTLTTFMGPADRGDESHATYLRRQRNERRSQQTSVPGSPALAPPGQSELEYMR
jgi:hypothetical protein